MLDLFISSSYDDGDDEDTDTLLDMLLERNRTLLASKGGPHPAKDVEALSPLHASAIIQQQRRRSSQLPLSPSSGVSYCNPEGVLLEDEVPLSDLTRAITTPPLPAPVARSTPHPPSISLSQSSLPVSQSIALTSKCPSFEATIPASLLSCSAPPLPPSSSPFPYSDMTLAHPDGAASLTQLLAGIPLTQKTINVLLQEVT